MDVDIEVVVDDWELASEVPGWLARQQGVFVVTSRLASADYSIRGIIGIERKTAVVLDRASDCQFVAIEENARVAEFIRDAAASYREAGLSLEEINVLTP